MKKPCLENIFKFYRKNNNDNILKLVVLFANTLNLFFLIDTPYCLPITILVFIIYFYTSKLKVKKKKIMALTWLTFSIFTILGESFIISTNTGSSLHYNNSDIHNVSSWLFSAYASMVLAVMFIKEYYDETLQ